MDESGPFSKIFLLLALMAAIAVVETWLPLRDPRDARGGRRRTNLVLTLFYFGINLGLTVAVLGVMAWMEQHRFGLMHALELTPVWSFVLGVGVLDFFAYAVHVLMHQVPWFWRFHRVHHSDPVVDVTTAFRQHPLEAALRFVFTYAPAALLGVSPLATAAYRLLSGVNALFEHANLRVHPLLDRSLRWLVVTPHMHKIHHSRVQRETDSNYGNIFSGFDRLFGSYTPTDRVGQVRYGLDEFGVTENPGFLELMRLPWRARPR